jgi:hypothetical protein
MVSADELDHMHEWWLEESGEGEVWLVGGPGADKYSCGVDVRPVRWTAIPPQI